MPKKPFTKSPVNTISKTSLDMRIYIYTCTEREGGRETDRHACVYVYMYTCILKMNQHVNMCPCVRVYVCVHVYVYRCIYVYVSVPGYVHVDAYVYVYVYVCVCVYVYVSVYVDLYTCAVCCKLNPAVSCQRQPRTAQRHVPPREAM